MRTIQSHVGKRLTRAKNILLRRSGGGVGFADKVRRREGIFAGRFLRILGCEELAHGERHRTAGRPGPQDEA